MTTYTIYSWNINGIRASSKNGLRTWILQTDFDILCLQEIKANADQFPENLSGLGYSIDIHSAARKGYSGVATFSKKRPLEVSTTIGQAEFDNEGRILMTRYPDFHLFNVYFPNGKKNKQRLDYKMRFYEKFHDMCKQLLEKGQSIVVCGDVNTAHKEQDLAHPKPNSKRSGFLQEERAWIDQFLADGFIDTYRCIHGDGEGDYTWWSVRSRSARQKNVGWRLDYFFISEDLKNNLRSATIHQDVKGSDHCPISITLEFA